MLSYVFTSVHPISNLLLETGSVLLTGCSTLASGKTWSFVGYTRNKMM